MVAIDLWTAVARRIEEVRQRYVPSAGGGQGKTKFYPLSGLLRCAECDSPMVINRETHAGYYMCGTAKKRRACKNRQSVREDIARERIFGAIERAVLAPRTLSPSSARPLSASSSG